MKTKLNSFFAVLFLLLVFSCEPSVETEPLKTDPTEVNNLISSASPFAKPQEYAPMQIGTDIVTTETASNGLQYKVTTKNMKTAKAFDKIPMLNSTKKGLEGSADLYVGSIVQGKLLMDGQLSSIGDIAKRKEITITVTGIVLGKNSVVVQNPSNATITTAINGLFSNLNGAALSVNQIYKFEQTEAYQKEQALLSIGLNYKFLGNGISGDFSVQNTTENSSVYILFKQEYFTISVNSPGTPSDFFADDVDIEKIKYVAKADNPLGYVSSITYGRMLIAKVTSSYKQKEMNAALNAKLGKLGAAASAKQDEILKNCTFTVQVAGGNTQTLINSIEGVYTYINNGISKLSSFSDAVPISYDVKYLSNNQLFYTGIEVEYQQKEYEPLMQDFEIFIHGFSVIKHCDDLTGDGEFYYTIKANGVKIDSISSSAARSAADGQFISINTSKIISVPKSKGQKLNIQCTLKESDLVSDDIVGVFSQDFLYPWSDADISNNVFDDGVPCWLQKFEQSSVCSANFVFAIRKKYFHFVM